MYHCHTLGFLFFSQLITFVLLTPSVFHYYLFFHNQTLFTIYEIFVLWTYGNSNCFTYSVLYSKESGLYFFFDL